MRKAHKEGESSVDRKKRRFLVEGGKMGLRVGGALLGVKAVSELTDDIGERELRAYRRGVGDGIKIGYGQGWGDKKEGRKNRFEEPSQKNNFPGEHAA